MPKDRATLYVNKLAAARRQIDAAIRMRFANEDELAVHTVAAAAYRILRDLTDKRGRNHLEETIRDGIYSIALRLAEGRLLAAEIEQIKRWNMFDLYSSVASDIKSQRTKFDRNKIRVNLGAEMECSYWKKMSKAANFLKHADRDSDSMLVESEIDNDNLIMGACSAYANLMHKVTPEMDVFWVLWSIAPERNFELPESHSDIVAVLRRTRPEKRLRTCTRLVESIKHKQRGQ